MKRGLKIKCSSSSVQTEKLECKEDDIVLEGKRIDLTFENDTALERKRIDLASENGTVLEGKKIDLASENDTVLEGYSTESAYRLSIKEGTEHTDIQIGGNTLFDRNFSKEQCCR